MSEAKSDHVAGNRAAWEILAADFAKTADREWSAVEPMWGIFLVPESQLRLLPADMKGLDTIELGCGTGYVSAWMARRGARPVGIDNSPKQLETAREMQQKHGLSFPLHLGNAEATPFPDASFDFAISEYGASIWCDPYRWIPEAARLLRPGGQLIFMANGLQLMLCTNQDDEDAPVTTELQRDLFGMHRFEWSDGAVEFHLPHGEMIRLLRNSGFEIVDLIEVQPPAGATTSYPYVTAEWARRWPCEEVWNVRKR
jgi:SAM-dependent methyltransferase